MILNVKNFLIELVDAAISFILIAFILVKFHFPWNMLLIGILILPFGIGIVRGIIANNKE